MSVEKTPFAPATGSAREPSKSEVCPERSSASFRAEAALSELRRHIARRLREVRAASRVTEENCNIFLEQRCVGREHELAMILPLVSRRTREGTPARNAGTHAPATKNL